MDPSNPLGSFQGFRDFKVSGLAELLLHSEDWRLGRSSVDDGSTHGGIGKWCKMLETAWVESGVLGSSDGF